MNPIAVGDLLERARGSIKVGDHGEAEGLLKIYAAKHPDKRDVYLLPGNRELLDLLRHLRNLAAALPDQVRKDFFRSDARLSMEYLISLMEGRKGLYRDVQERMPKAVNMADTERVLVYLEQLTAELPDPDLSFVMSRKVNAIIKEIRQRVIKGD